MRIDKNLLPGAIAPWVAHGQAVQRLSAVDMLLSGVGIC